MQQLKLFIFIFVIFSHIIAILCKLCYNKDIALAIFSNSGKALLSEKIRRLLIMNTKRSERVNYMISNFMDWHNAGMSIKEIAEKASVTTRTIYQRLQEIADLNGVSRESLLEVVHKPHEVTATSKRASVSKINADELIARYEAVIQSTNQLQENIKNIIRQQEEL